MMTEAGICVERVLVRTMQQRGSGTIILPSISIHQYTLDKFYHDVNRWRHMLCPHSHTTKLCELVVQVEGKRTDKRRRLEKERNSSRPAMSDPHSGHGEQNGPAFAFPTARPSAVLPRGPQRFPPAGPTVSIHSPASNVHPPNRLGDNGFIFPFVRIFHFISTLFGTK
jgi:hypothetical protein